MSPLPSSRVRDLNDLLRRSFASNPAAMPGAFKVLITQGAGSLGAADFTELVGKVEAFNVFNDDNDPHGEHDFGAIEQSGDRYFWKIDYYDLTLSGHSPDPADPAKTCRVLTIMRADEY